LIIPDFLFIWQEASFINKERIQTFAFGTRIPAACQVQGLCQCMETPYYEMRSKYSYNCLEKISGLGNLI